MINSLFFIWVLKKSLHFIWVMNRCHVNPEIKKFSTHDAKLMIAVVYWETKRNKHREEKKKIIHHNKIGFLSELDIATA